MGIILNYFKIWENFLNFTGLFWNTTRIILNFAQKEEILSIQQEFVMQLTKILESFRISPCSWLIAVDETLFGDKTSGNFGIEVEILWIFLKYDQIVWVEFFSKSIWNNMELFATKYYSKKFGIFWNRYEFFARYSIWEFVEFFKISSWIPPNFFVFVGFFYAFLDLIINKMSEWLLTLDKKMLFNV